MADLRCARDGRHCGALTSSHLKMGKPKQRGNPQDPAVTRPGVSGPAVHGSQLDALPPALQLTLDKILQAITDTRDTLQLQIGTVSTELGLPRADHRNLVDRVKTTEDAVDILKPEQQILLTKV